MAYPIWQATITDDNGNVLPGAEITVVNETTGLNAPLYSTRNGTSKTNPFFATVDGFAQFYAAPGLYRITATDGGTGTTQTFRYVRLVEVGTAVGELMQVGAFGLGDVMPLVSDPDDRFTKNGFYLASSSLTADKPFDSFDYFIEHFRSGSGGSVTQNAFNINMAYGGPRIKHRGWNNGTSQWTPWVEMYHTGNSVGTVSQSGGVPTGAIIERGTNANGEYVKFADGTMICTLGYIGGTEITDTFTSSGVTYYRRRINGSFPVSFLSESTISLQFTAGQNIDNTLISTAIRSVTTSGYSVDAVSIISYAVASLLGRRIFVIGRWY